MTPFLSELVKILEKPILHISLVTQNLEVVMKKLALIGALIITSLAARAAPEAIFVAYPPPNYEVGFDHVLFEGSVLPGANLLVDGKVVDTGQDGLFIEWLPLKPGANTIRLESNLGAVKATQEIKVTSSPQTALPISPTIELILIIRPYRAFIMNFATAREQ